MLAITKCMDRVVRGKRVDVTGPSTKRPISFVRLITDQPPGFVIRVEAGGVNGARTAS